MTAAPLVSVITPFFNADRFIREAIESVLSQTYADWELLLVDDGSRDGSARIAREFSMSDPARIRILEHSGHVNRGAAASRNLAIRSSRGSCLAFLDADDVWLPQKLSRQVEIMRAMPDAAMVFGTPLYWRCWRRPPHAAASDSIPPLWIEPNTLVRPPRMVHASYPLGPGGAPCPSDLLVRRESVERVGGFEESFTGKYQLFEDQAFLAKIYLTGSVFVADECWTKYRQHDDSCVAVVRRSGQYHDVRRHYLLWLRQYLRSTGNRDRGIQQLLAHALRKYDPPLLQWTHRQWRRLKRRLTGTMPLQSSS